MALPSRLGSFMVGAAAGATQSFYWLYHDVYEVQAALSRKVETVRLRIEAQAHEADLRLAAVKDTASTDNDTSVSRKLSPDAASSDDANDSTAT